MIADYFADAGDGLDYGIDRVLKFAMQDPTIPTEKPDDIRHPKAFIVGQRTGEIVLGLVSFVFFDLGTLGILPLYNYYKYKKD